MINIQHAYAKINLAIDVTGVRDNGYHDVDMIMQSISLSDLVTVELTDTPGIELTSSTADLPTDDGNIAYRAAALMLQNIADHPGLPGVRIHIDKHIPVAAGMAGGSTDGAAVLRALNELLSLNPGIKKLSPKELMELGLKLGADVPYCICGGTMRSRGIGEILSPLPKLPDCYILTAKPPYAVSTRDVYRGIDKINYRHADIEAVISALCAGSLDEIAGSMSNVLENYTIREHPDIDLIKAAMLDYGASGALMSGSGPTVFGLFKDEENALACGRNISETVSGVSVDISVPVNHTDNRVLS